MILNWQANRSRRYTARFLFCPVPEAGDTYPIIPVTLELKSRGHDVAYGFT
jgi:UDP:flavonoid glycosyltransferase YjiC (YdhE family)